MSDRSMLAEEIVRCTLINRGYEPTDEQVMKIASGVNGGSSDCLPLLAKRLSEYPEKQCPST